MPRALNDEQATLIKWLLKKVGLCPAIGPKRSAERDRILAKEFGVSEVVVRGIRTGANYQNIPLMPLNWSVGIEWLEFFCKVHDAKMLDLKLKQERNGSETA